MKKYVICSLTIFLAAFTFTAFAQGPGNFYVENKTDCPFTINLWHVSSGCNSSGCPATAKVTATTQAAANTTTLVDDGSMYGSSNAWIQFSVQPEQDGECGSSGNGADCNGSDIFVDWVDCNNGIIDYE